MRFDPLLTSALYQLQMRGLPEAHRSSVPCIRDRLPPRNKDPDKSRPQGRFEEVVRC